MLSNAYIAGNIQIYDFALIKGNVDVEIKPMNNTNINAIDFKLDSLAINDEAVIRNDNEFDIYYLHEFLRQYNEKYNQIEYTGSINQNDINIYKDIDGEVTIEIDKGEALYRTNCSITDFMKKNFNLQQLIGEALDIEGIEPQEYNEDDIER